MHNHRWPPKIMRVESTLGSHKGHNAKNQQWDVIHQSQYGDESLNVMLFEFPHTTLLRHTKGAQMM